MCTNRTLNLVGSLEQMHPELQMSLEFKHSHDIKSCHVSALRNKPEGTLFKYTKVKILLLKKQKTNKVKPSPSQY